MYIYIYVYTHDVMTMRAPPWARLCCRHADGGYYYLLYYTLPTITLPTVTLLCLLLLSL